jgi:hypothetical protein
MPLLAPVMTMVLGSVSAISSPSVERRGSLHHPLGQKSDAARKARKPSRRCQSR